MTGSQVAQRFAERLRAGESLFGTFVKSPDFRATEILGEIGFDFVVIDQEHAALNRESIDTIILAALSRNMAPLVRVGDPSDSNIMAQLDAGASGILVPHVLSAEKAANVVAACRYAGGRRGFSRTGRAGNYSGVSTKDHLASQDGNILCIGMIEDPEAIEAIDDIAAVKGLDALFVGRGDLSVAMGEDGQTADAVLEATNRVIFAAAKAGKPVMMLAADDKDQAALTAAGVHAFLTGSDQGFLRKAATAALAGCRAVSGRKTNE